MAVGELMFRLKGLLCCSCSIGCDYIGFDSVIAIVKQLFFPFMF